MSKYLFSVLFTLLFFKKHGIKQKYLYLKELGFLFPLIPLSYFLHIKIKVAEAWIKLSIGYFNCYLTFSSLQLCCHYIGLTKETLASGVEDIISRCHVEDFHLLLYWRWNLKPLLRVVKRPQSFIHSCKCSWCWE